MNRIGEEGEEDVGFAVVEPTTGQKLAGLMLRVFGYSLLILATGVFGILGIMYLAMEGEAVGGDWIWPLLLAVGSLVAMGVGGLMNAVGLLLGGTVRVGGREHRWKWCLVRGFRDPLIMIGGYFLVGAGVYCGAQAWAQAGRMFVIGGLALLGGVVLTRGLRRLVRDAGGMRRGWGGWGGWVRAVVLGGTREEEG